MYKKVITIMLTLLVCSAFTINFNDNCTNRVCPNGNITVAFKTGTDNQTVVIGNVNKLPGVYMLMDYVKGSEDGGNFITSFVVAGNPYTRMEDNSTQAGLWNPKTFRFDSAKRYQAFPVPKLEIADSVELEFNEVGSEADPGTLTLIFSK